VAGWSTFTRPARRTLIVVTTAWEPTPWRAVQRVVGRLGPSARHAAIQDRRIGLTSSIRRRDPTPRRSCQQAVPTREAVPSARDGAATQSPATELWVLEPSLFCLVAGGGLVALVLLLFDPLQRSGANPLEPSVHSARIRRYEPRSTGHDPGTVGAADSAGQSNSGARSSDGTAT
jgi:hypothetical protein